MRKGEHNGGRRTGRGFEDFGVVIDNRGNEATVRQSSSAEGDFVWIFVKDREGRETYEHMGKHHAAAMHMNPEQARRLAAALLRFADAR